MKLNIAIFFRFERFSFIKKEYSSYNKYDCLSIMINLQIWWIIFAQVINNNVLCPHRQYEVQYDAHFKFKDLSLFRYYASCNKQYLYFQGDSTTIYSATLADAFDYHVLRSDKQYEVKYYEHFQT